MKESQKKVCLFKLVGSADMRDDRCLSYVNPNKSKWQFLKELALNELSHEQITAIELHGSYIYSSEGPQM